jgi:predicted SAM-dependent methyltransferase
MLESLGYVTSIFLINTQHIKVAPMLKKLKSILNPILFFYHRLVHMVANLNKPQPIYPKVSHKGLRIHLGAGPINLQGWINIDARMYEHTHLVAQGFNLDEFSDGSISEIYMCHVLEHFSFEESELLLRSIKKKLSPRGIIRISVPSFDNLIQVYMSSNKNLDSIKFAVMGGQDYEFNYHKSLYNVTSLTTLLKLCGYINVEAWDTRVDFGVDLGDWSNKSFSTPRGLIEISLNLKAKNSI